MNAQALASLVWSIAELLRGDYRQSDYGKVILPFTVLRRLDCVLEPTKADVLAEHARVKKDGLPPEHFLLEKSKQSFFNSSPMDMGKLLGDPANLRANILSYVNGFSENVRDIFEKFEFEKQIERLDGANLLFLIVQKFASVDLHPNVVSNADMGHMFEELIRRFAELSNETAGEHFTPREVIRLMVNLLFIEDDGGLSVSGAVRSIYDPTAGTGGMLSVAEEHLLAMNPKAKLSMHGQELNPESFAICKADMLVKGQDVTNIVFGNTLSNDGHSGKKFDYMLSNPPFGVEWKKVEEVVRKEHESKKQAGRFGPGLPRVSDGSLLFLLHLISKMRDATVGGSRIGIVLNGSPLFSGGAGSGESDIRKYLFENDLVEAIVALPTDMFYNTGIGTYVWILTNRKSEARKGVVQLIDGSFFWDKMRKSLGSKRREMRDADIATLTQIYGDLSEKRLVRFVDSGGKELARHVLGADAKAPVHVGARREEFPLSKLMRNEDFGYAAVTIERPLRLSFAVDEGSAQLFEEAASSKKKVSSDEVDAGRKVIQKMRGLGAMKGRAGAEAAVKQAAEALGVEPSAWCKQAILSAVQRRDPKGELQKDSRGVVLADPDLREVENVPLTQLISDYMKEKVLPFASDAWVDESKTRVGYEVAFNRLFFVPAETRAMEELEAAVKAAMLRVADLAKEFAE